MDEERLFLELRTASLDFCKQLLLASGCVGYIK
jgi:hypothetical protein